MWQAFKGFVDANVNVFVVVGTVLTALTLFSSSVRGIIARWAHIAGSRAVVRPPNDTIPEAKKIEPAVAVDGKRAILTFDLWLARLWFAALSNLYYWVPRLPYQVPEGSPVVDNGIYNGMRNSADFFSHRFQEAFPAVRSNTSFTSPSDISHRLSLLLKQPLSASKDDTEVYRTPLWWFHGRGNLHIKRFVRIKPRVFLLRPYGNGYCKDCCGARRRLLAELCIRRVPPAAANWLI